MKHPENLHRDYVPHSIITHFKSRIVDGIIVLLCFHKTKNLTAFEKILSFFKIVKTKEVYYWLPFKSVVEGNSKYGVIGPKSRDPYAMQWFELRDSHYIYKRSLDTLRVLHKNKVVFHHPPVQREDMLILTRKAVIKMLDDFVFVKKQQHRK